MKKLLGKDLALFDTDSGKDLQVHNGDLVLTDGLDNLVQALSLRLCSYRGILKQLGHPSYGSRLLEAVGEMNNKLYERMVKNLISEAILQEPRVRSIVQIYVQTNTIFPEQVEIEISVLPINQSVPLNLVVNLNLGMD